MKTMKKEAIRQLEVKLNPVPLLESKNKARLERLYRLIFL